ncbi:hypothetical protein [Streptomyces sp. NPDC026673]|uniref:hypothetical protein n=1 Tax=Streptomyces sp. NPDC026673 TaxID=3155724 RepID=UPI0033E3468B
MITDARGRRRTLVTLSLALAAGTVLTSACDSTVAGPGRTREAATAPADPSGVPAPAMSSTARVRLTEVPDMPQASALKPCAGPDRPDRSYGLPDA